MDKKTLIAVVLSVVIIIGSMVIQNIFFPVKQPSQIEEKATVKTSTSSEQGKAPATEEETTKMENATSRVKGTGFVQPKKEGLNPRDIEVRTDYFDIVFSTKGGVVKAYKLRQFKNVNGSLVEMVHPGDSGRYMFVLHFGNFQSPTDDAIYHFRRISEYKYEMYKDFYSPSGIPFRIRKVFYFPPHEYLFELKIYIENSINEFPDLDFNGYAYSLEIGPQIGPHFAKLNGRNDYRRYMYYVGGKKHNVKVSSGKYFIQNDRVTWSAIVGKYFTVIAVPDATKYQIVYDAVPIKGLKERNSLFFTRPIIKSTKSVDTFKVYIGPKKRDILTRYDDPAKNIYKIGDLHFEEVVSYSVLIGWLANILKFLLELFYKIIPNYGVDIILLTILIKLLLFPLTHKSYESTSKMQALSPKIEEIKAKYKDKPERMNQEMAELYKREGVNPLGGCLPMLLQLPIFFAFYSLLSNHFELRGALFIPGWINDLSAPETIWNFAPYRIPILGWQNLRLLPFIMLVSSFLQSKVSQTPGSSSGSMGNMKLMAYAMPLIFFFILYDMPSGLVLYWTVQGILTIFQQLYINKIMKTKKGNTNDSGSGGSRKRPRRFRR